MRIYIAGFDVFRKDAVEYGISCKKLCASYGIGALYPFDNEADNAPDIFRGNLALIDACDVVCANLNAFRGKSRTAAPALSLDMLMQRESGYTAISPSAAHCAKGLARQIRAATAWRISAYR
mgnify:CR=1 FL=1